MRKDFLHKETSRIIHENQVIILEDLRIKEMLEEKIISKQISDASWRTFRDMLAYKANWYGRTLITVNKNFPSSQLCNACGKINQTLPWGKRNWTCPKCGINHDRDENAAKNILAAGLKLVSI